MVQRKTFRFGSRPVATSATEMTLSAEDAQNLDSYVVKIKEAVGVLEQEIAAIKRGELENVGTLFQEKSDLLKWLELRTPLIEPFLNHERAQKLRLKGHLADLKAKIEEDGALLSRMAVAARSVVREMEKVYNRNSLGSTYSKSGQRRDAGNQHRTRFDEKI